MYLYLYICLKNSLYCFQYRIVRILYRNGIVNLSKLESQNGQEHVENCEPPPWIFGHAPIILREKERPFPTAS